MALVNFHAIYQQLFKLLIPFGLNQSLSEYSCQPSFRTISFQIHGLPHVPVQDSHDKAFISSWVSFTKLHFWYEVRDHEKLLGKSQCIAWHKMLQEFWTVIRKVLHLRIDWETMFSMTLYVYSEWLSEMDTSNRTYRAKCRLPHSLYLLSLWSIFYGKAYIQNKKKSFVLVLYRVSPPKLKFLDTLLEIRTNWVAWRKVQYASRYGLLH